MITVKVSKAFLADRESRDLPVGAVSSFCGNKAKTSLAHDTLSEMVGDAAYQGWFTDASSPGVVRAARTAFRDLVRHGATYKGGVVTNEKTGLLMPQDAA